MTASNIMEFEHQIYSRDINDQFVVQTQTINPFFTVIRQKEITYWFQFSHFDVI
eukprot:gnl/Chilomastix_caulleri/4641.p4 GENE.gnl/Chilomastix_caulleri/4641~~gnl/Chilomastix_caulleri/4641.p4  ORF type:complete len:54 (-),score=9.56 gnl/Chilomastix_caulleri/4641:38-199(-)